MDRPCIQMVLFEHIMEMDNEDLIEFFETATGETLKEVKKEAEDDEDEWLCDQSLLRLVGGWMYVEGLLDHLRDVGHYWLTNKAKC